MIDIQDVPDMMRVFLFASAALILVLYAWSTLRSIAASWHHPLGKGRAARLLAITCLLILSTDDLLQRMHHSLSWRSPVYCIALIALVCAWGWVDKIYAPLPERTRR